ncbi:FERM, RhoGEF and pleckstrin domain-containing protein 2 [Oopsacas minuta]|uniref:FERM, RhoGEF and pleckstrin domain-containing protein 2 n=1 Tax=Oopsacas minuta TaxID=111878 RepID=A0AAV7K617_9METZ|nr:FERM, RhoGEF and pleckstrin domain-containing protein 2 [Oopsacas minuta]
MTEKYTVYFYHGTKEEFEIPRKSKIQALFDQCCKHLHIEEVDYFSLFVHDQRGKVFWLNSDKSIRKQLTPVLRDNIHFGVKYYHMDPTQVYSEETRLYFVHQVIDDIRAKHYTLSEKDLNIITALYIQSELGDYEEGTNIPGYTKDYFLFNFQSPDCEDDIVAEHKATAGRTPGQCENEILSMVKQQEMYGMHLNVGYLQVGKGQRPVQIGVHPHGITILDDEFAKLYDLPWDIVTKLEAKRRKFIIRAKGVLETETKDVVEKEEGAVPPTKEEGATNVDKDVIEAPATNEDPEQTKLSVEEALEDPPVEAASPVATENADVTTDETKQSPAHVEDPAVTEEISPAPEQPTINEEPTPKQKQVTKSKKREPITVLKFIISERTYVKDIWRLAAEHHYFFNRVPTRQPRFSFVRIGSRFRYSGRTFRQSQKDFSERKFDPIDPDVRVRMSQRRKRQSVNNDETEDSSYPGYVKARESFRRERVESGTNGDVAEKADTNEIVVENNPVEIPEPGTQEALLQKDVTDKFLDNEFQEAAKQTEGDDLPAAPSQNELIPENGDMADYPPPPKEHEEMVSGDTKVVETAVANEATPAVSNEQ